jgi:hypothetical protein
VEDWSRGVVEQPDFQLLHYSSPPLLLSHFIFRTANMPYVTATPAAKPRRAVNQKLGTSF